MGDAEARTRELGEEILGKLARRHSTATVLFHHAVADRLGLGPADHKCLDLLLERGPMTGSELAAITGLTSGAVSGVVARLEQTGRLRRVPHPNDGRKQVLSPSPQGVKDVQEVSRRTGDAAPLEDFRPDQSRRSPISSLARPTTPPPPASCESAAPASERPLRPSQREGVDMTDDQQLRELFDRMCQAWTDGDARAYGACFTADCDYVSYDGYWERGREPMVASHDKLFRGVLTGSALVGEVESIRHLGDDIALGRATGSVLVAWRTRLPRRRRTRNTIVALRTPEGWRFTHPQRPHPPVGPRARLVPLPVACSFPRQRGSRHRPGPAMATR